MLLTIIAVIVVWQTNTTMVYVRKHYEFMGRTYLQTHGEKRKRTARQTALRTFIALLIVIAVSAGVAYLRWLHCRKMLAEAQEICRTEPMPNVPVNPYDWDLYTSDPNITVSGGLRNKTYNLNPKTQKRELVSEISTLSLTDYGEAKNLPVDVIKDHIAFDKNVVKALRKLTHHRQLFAGSVITNVLLLLMLATLIYSGYLQAITAYAALYK